MKVLVACTPATGHLNPLLAVARGLIDDRHDVTFLTGSMLQSRVEAIGGKFRALPADADLELRDMDGAVPELKHVEPGLQWLSIAIQRFFVDTMPAQLAGVRAL